MDLLRLLRVLAEAGPEFVLIGGLAAAAHGSPLVTQDVDIACPMDPAHLRLLHSSLAPWHPRHRRHPARPPFTAAETGLTSWKNLYLTTDLGQLDCLGEVLGLGSFEQVRPLGQPVDLGDFRVQVLSLDALLRAKEALGRPRDLLAAQHLRALRDRSPGAGR